MRHSLKGRLRWLVGIVITAVLVPLAIFEYRRSLQEMNELADGRLAQAARTVETLVENSDLGDSLRNGAAAMGHRHGNRGNRALIVPVGGRSCSIEGDSCEHEVGFQVADSSGALLVETQNLTGFPWPKIQEAGFHDVSALGERWRTYAMTNADNGDVIRVAERYDSRGEIAGTLRLDALSLLIALPLLALLVGWAVQRGLGPLQRLAEKLSGRSPGSREPIRLDAAPLELQPVLAALNDLLDRSEDALEREHQFAADVAHELRTPLAGAMMHLQNANTRDVSPQLAQSLASVRSGLEKLARRIEQLLALARLEAGAASGEQTSVDLAILAADILDELTPLLESRDADVSLTCDPAQGGFMIQGHVAALGALLRNLVENALRHSPVRAMIEIRLSRNPGHIDLDVIDSGPGIPEPRRKAVFARFHREPDSRQPSGHGLGLSIVLRAAELHEAHVELLDAPNGQGLRVKVSFPAKEVI